MAGAEELKEFLMSVDEDRDERSVWLMRDARCVCVCVSSCRYVEDVMAILADDATGVSSFKQFRAVKFEDIEWPEGSTAGGRKVFVRMAIKKLKAETGKVPNVALGEAGVAANCLWQVLRRRPLGKRLAAATKMPSSGKLRSALALRGRMHDRHAQADQCDVQNLRQAEGA